MIRPVSSRPARTVRLALLTAVAVALAACSSGGPTSAAVPSAAASAGSASGCPTSAPAPMAAGQTATVAIQTPKGTITIKVEGSLGPNAAGNFVALARCGYYDGVIFHRLAPGFVIQGGDGQYGRTPNVDSAHVGLGGPGYAFADDPVSTPYARGTVAMANSGANTNGSQFFIVLADAQLQPAYSIFGQVTAGMDVVDAIAAMPNGGGQSNQALDPVPMTRLTVSQP
ncbi:MAG: peptidylprolyl isomerase [Candidatus Limnocylindrales bacterium]